MRASKKKLKSRKSFLSKKNLRKKIAEPLFECEECGKKYTRKMVKLLEDGREVCLECLFEQYDKFRGLYKAVILPVGVDSRYCDICGKSTINSSFHHYDEWDKELDPEGRWRKEVKVLCCDDCGEKIISSVAPFWERYEKEVAKKLDVDLFLATEYLYAFWVLKDKESFLQLLNGLVFRGDGVRVFYALYDIAERENFANAIIVGKNTRNKNRQAKTEIWRMKRDTLRWLRKKKRGGKKLSKLENLVLCEIAADLRQFSDKKIVKFLSGVKSKYYRFIQLSPVLSRFLAEYPSLRNRFCQKLSNFPQKEDTPIRYELKIRKIFPVARRCCV